MFKKPNSWQEGIKMVSKFLGFDVQQQNQANRSNHGQNGLLSLKSNSQIPVFCKSQHKSFQLKQEWRRLMKFPSKVKYRQIIQLLRQGSAMQDETWIWMLRNSQKISPELYTSKKQLLSQIIYPKNPFKGKDSFTEENIQVQDLEWGLEQKMQKKQTVNYSKKRKFSITKNGIPIKNQPSLTGRLSLNSQASTFSSSQSQTSNTKQTLQPQCYHQSIMLDSLLSCSGHPNDRSPTIMPQFTSHKSQSQHNNSNQCQQPHVNPFEPPYLACMNQGRNFTQLVAKINHPLLTSIIGAFLLHREDFTYSVTLFNMAATLFYYTNSNEMKTFTLLNHVACTEFFVRYLTKDQAESTQLLGYITQKVSENCTSAVFLKKFRLKNFVENWLYGFFYSICENGTQIKEKLISYLLINAFSVNSIIRVCSSLIYSLGRVINQGYQDKIYQCLQNPKLYIDKNVFYDRLLRYQE